jgi:hypothetical protein
VTPITPQKRAYRKLQSLDALVTRTCRKLDFAQVQSQLPLVGFTSMWTGFINSERHIGTSPLSKSALAIWQHARFDATRFAGQMPVSSILLTKLLLRKPFPRFAVPATKTSRPGPWFVALYSQLERRPVSERSVFGFYGGQLEPIPGKPLGSSMLEGVWSRACF